MLVTRKNGGDVVILAAEEFSALEETAYLLRSPANAIRLLDAVARDRSGATGRSFASVVASLGLEDEAQVAIEFDEVRS